MQLISKFNKGIRVFFYVLLIFLVNMYGLFLKDKKAVTITNAFQSILNDSKIKPNKIWLDKGSEFYYSSQWNHE